LFTLTTYLFILSVCIQLFYAWVYTFKKNKESEQKINSLPEPVSVIICARNEAANLLQFLPFVLEQDYTGSLFEVVVVNDGSTDVTAEILSGLKRRYAHLSVLTLPADMPRDLPGKKFALAQGIKAAKYERLLLTDADCKPSSSLWLKNMALSAEDIVLGYGAYETHPGLLNKFIRWETVHTCMQYMSYVHMGIPYMGVGRNLAYKKSIVSVLEKDEQFKAVYSNTPSGDDDLLISRLVNTATVATCMDKEAHTISVPEKKWRSWWQQKTRHISTGKYYPERVRYLLGTYALSHSLYWITGLILIIRACLDDPSGDFSMWHIDGCLILPNKFVLLLLALFTVRLIMYWAIAARWYRLLNEKKILLFYPAGDLGWALYNVFLSPYIFWKNKRTWK